MLQICTLIVWVGAIMNTVKQRAEIKSLPPGELFKKVGSFYVAAACLTLCCLL